MNPAILVFPQSFVKCLSLGGFFLNFLQFECLFNSLKCDVQNENNHSSWRLTSHNPGRTVSVSGFEAICFTENSWRVWHYRKRITKRTELIFISSYGTVTCKVYVGIISLMHLFTHK